MAEVDCDVAVAGGGPAGATAALTLARAGYRVVLIEGSLYEHPRVGETLPPSARLLLGRLGLWGQFAALHASPSYGNQSAWGGPDLRVLPFIFNPHGSGWHLDRPRFDSLLASAAASAGARWLGSRKVTACKPGAGGSWKLTLESLGKPAGELISRAVIDATGRRAFLAHKLGAKRRLFDHLVGVAVQYRSPDEQGGYTLVEAAPEGWWYSAPIPPDRMVVMLMTDADLCRLGKRFDPQVWEQGLAQTEHTRRRLSGFDRIWEPKVFSAVSHRLERTGWEGRWLACGDAAMGVDPLSSSGIVRAIRSGELAGLAMAAWLQGFSEPACDYERWLDAEFAEYWGERSAYYRLESRWPGEPFWQRRHGIELDRDINDDPAA